MSTQETVVAGPVYPTTRRAVTLSLAGKTAELASLALLVTVVPRRLGPGDYGTFAVALALVTLGSTSLAFSGPAVMSRFVAATAPEDRAAMARALALRALRWRLIGLGAAAAAAAALVLLDRNRFALVPTALVLAALAVDAPATVAFQAALAVGRSGAWSFRYPIQNLLLVVGAVALYALAGLEGALAAIALSSAAALVAGLLLVGPPLRRARAHADVPSHVSRFAFIQGLSNLVTQAQHRGVVVVAALLAGSRTETGYAALAAGIGLAGTYAVWQVFTVTLPRFSAVAVDDPTAAEAGMRRLVGAALGLTVPGAIAAVVLVSPLLTLLAGRGFARAEHALGPALAMLPFAPLAGAVGAASALRLQATKRLWTAVAEGVAFAVAAVLLVPPYGAAGATSALLIATGTSALAGVVLFPRLVDGARIAIAGGGCAIVLTIAFVR